MHDRTTEDIQPAIIGSLSALFATRVDVGAYTFKPDRMFGTFSASIKSKLERFAVVRFSGPNNVREVYRESVSDELARVDKYFPQTIWDSVTKILKTAAKTTVRLRPKQVKSKGIFDPVIDHMSREQTDLR